MNGRFAPDSSPTIALQWCPSCCSALKMCRRHTLFLACRLGLLNAGGMRLATTEATAENSSQLMRHRDALFSPVGSVSSHQRPTGTRSSRLSARSVRTSVPPGRALLACRLGQFAPASHRDALTPLGFKSLYTSKEHRDSLLAVPVLFGGEGGI